MKNEFLSVENISDKERKDILCLSKHTMIREHGGMNGYTQSEMFLSKGRLNNCNSNKKIKQIKSVTYVGK